MTSHTEFGAETTAAEVATTFANEIIGKNVLITGISPESISASMALAIASQGPRKLLLASRTISKIDAVVRKIKEFCPDVITQAVVVDLASQDSIRQAADEVNESIEKLDVIINNAGVVKSHRDWTKEGIEIQFGVNHIGHFLLTNLLLDKMKAAAKQQSAPGATRVVNLTSLGHRISPVRFHDHDFEGKEIPEEERPMDGLPERMLRGHDGYPGFVAYGQSKTANILFSEQLTTSLGSQGIVSFSVHPGSIWTDLSRNLDAEDYETIKKTASVWKTHEQGAATTLVAAFDPALGSIPGGFMSDCQLMEPADHAKGSEKAEQLWQLSEKLTGCRFEI